MWPVELGKSFECISGQTHNVIHRYFCFYLSICRVDSVMLLEEDFEVISVDASDKMLKYALKERWNRRKEPAFDNWSKLE